MRIIDADKLNNDIKKLDLEYMQKQDIIEILEDTINKQPTINNNIKCACCGYEGAFKRIQIVDDYECDAYIESDGKYKQRVNLYGCPKCGTIKFLDIKEGDK